MKAAGCRGEDEEWDAGWTAPSGEGGVVKRHGSCSLRD